MTVVPFPGPKKNWHPWTQPDAGVVWLPLDVLDKLDALAEDDSTTPAEWLADVVRNAHEVREDERNPDAAIAREFGHLGIRTAAQLRDYLSRCGGDVSEG